MPLTSATTGAMGGVSLSRLPPGFGPASRSSQGASANRFATAVLPEFDHFALARNAGPKPGGSLERLTPPRHQHFQRLAKIDRIPFGTLAQFRQASAEHRRWGMSTWRPAEPLSTSF